MFTQCRMWTATEITMPEDMQEVVVFDEKKGVFIGHYFDGVKSFIHTVDGARLDHVRYWMVIPEPPGGPAFGSD